MNPQPQDNQIQDRHEDVLIDIVHKMSSLTTRARQVIQPLSLTEKKYLLEFWRDQWQTFKSAPASQNISEKRLREKFDGYVDINIQRHLVDEWNITFAGQYVQDEFEPRVERDSDQLRLLTKTWKWLCQHMGFKAWPGAIDDTYEDLHNIEVIIKDEPFSMSPAKAVALHNPQHNSSDTGDPRVYLPADVEAARTLQNICTSVPQEMVLFDYGQESIHYDARLMHAAQSHYHSMRESYESDVVNNEAMTRNDPHLNARVIACMMQELQEMQDQGFLPENLASTIRALVFQDGI